MEEKREQSKTSPNLDQSKALQKCISIFENAKTDNERFAGLLLVTQLVQSDTLDPAARRKLFDAVGFTFINRLLTTTEIPQDCPKDVFKSLALTILACFSTDSDHLFHPQMIAKIPLIGELISAGTPSEIVDDCFQILTSFASSVKGCAHLIRMGSTRVLCRIVEERSCSTALKVLLRMMHFCPGETWEEGRSDLVRVLPSLCKKFRDAQDASKFEMCNTLVSLLSGVESSSFGRFLADAEVGNGWQVDVSKGLQEILQSKVSSEQRDPALILTALLIDLIGMKWMMITHQNPPTTPAAKEVNEPELFIIAVSLASIEIRMILENSASKEEIIMKRSLLSACYDILERTIHFTASEVSVGEDEGEMGDYTTLSRKTVSRVYSLLKEAAESIMGFLDRASHHQQEMSNFSDDERHVLIASVRVVGVWIAEETSALQAEVHKLLPFLLKLGKDALESDVSVKALTKEPQTRIPEEGAQLAGELSGLHVSEDIASQPVILRFLLPGLCHLSADEDALKVLIENQTPALLGKYFFSEWKKCNNEMEDSDAMTTLTTLLGIFLNFAVMKPDLVRKDKVFQDLRRHATSSVSDLISHPEHVVFLANLVVLGLMLVRHQHVQHSAVDDESDMQPFFKAVLELLRSGIQLKFEKEEELAHKPSQLALACKTNWDDISELWFLGLQVLTSLLSQFPILRVVVKESCWCEEIEIHATANQPLAEIKKALLSFLKEFQRWPV